MKTLYLAAIVAYVLLLWAVGWMASHRSKGSEGYLVGSRQFSMPLVSAIVAGTWIGGVSVIGMAQGAFLHGLSAIWFQIGIWVAMCLTAAFLPKIIRGKKTYSILDVVGHAYDERTARVAGLFQLAFSIWVVTMQIVGGGAILSFILKDTLSPMQGMALTALVFALYNVLGGVVATAYTNLVHLVTIFVGVLLGGSYLLNEAGGLSTVRSALPSFYFDPLGNLGWINISSWVLVNLTVGLLAQPVINAGASAKDLRHGRLGILIGNLLAIPIPVVAALCGLLARYRYPDVASVKALPVLLNDLPPLLGLLFLLGIWAPLMSSGSPFLMGGTTIVIRGYVVRSFPRLPDKQLLVASRLVTLSIAALGFLLGSFVSEILRGVTEMAVLLTSVVILVLLGGFLKQPSKGGGFLALLVSLVLLAVFLSTGWAKEVHPFWAVCPAAFITVGVSTWIEGRRSSSLHRPTEIS